MNMVQTDKRSKGGQAAVAWILAVISVGYMLPWAIAATRGKSNAGAIGWLNFFLGWTMIGWIIALVMACGAHQVASGAVIVQAPGAQTAPPGWYPAPDGNGQRYWDGVNWTAQTAP